MMPRVETKSIRKVTGRAKARFERMNFSNDRLVIDANHIVPYSIHLVLKSVGKPIKRFVRKIIYILLGCLA